MSEEIRFWKDNISSVCDLALGLPAAGLRLHAREDVLRSCEKCCGTFDKDFDLSRKKIARLLAFEEFEGDRGRYVAALRNMLAEWQAASSGPSIPAMISAWYDCRGVGPADYETDAAPMMRASLTAGVLAEIPLRATALKGYHDIPHFREVTVMNMISFSGEEYVLGKTYPLKEAAKQATLAAAHDLFHTGFDNSQEGRYVRYYLERRSFDAFEPYMRACAVSEEDMEDIRTGILITDIMSGGEHQYAAHQYLRQACGYYFYGGAKPRLPEELSLLLPEDGNAGERGRALAGLCIRMQESDTVCSALDEDSFRFRFMQLRAENPEKYPSGPRPGSFAGFVRYILGDGREEGANPAFLSPFYKEWFQERLNKVLEGAEDTTAEDHGRS